MKLLDRPIVTSFVLVASLVLIAPVPLWGQTPAWLEQSTRRCGEVVDDIGNRLGGEAVTWASQSETGQRRRLDQQCATLGPIVLRTDPAPTTRAGADSLVIVSWNVHVGGGDIEAVLDQLAAHHGGLSSPDYVLLIEEAYRASDLVPASIESGVRVPRRIAPRHKDRVRDDVVSIARRRGLALYYVPSMRNGRGLPYEDRGNAILSTLPLRDLSAIELPMDRQRRVAISATVQGIDNQSRPWRIRLVTVHLDALVGAKRLWIFATGWRGRQARTVVDAIDHTEPAVVGADLNTWVGGRWESAYRRFARAWPAAQTAMTAAAPDEHGRLDFMFSRLPAGWMKTSQRLDMSFGSDHRPIVGHAKAPNRSRALVPGAGVPGAG